ncbi:hypothetical protein FRB95_006624 [Tulasnella sp. JGI-2019a]|nr:hypothetical protein FRB95_006624 [Tulasnella sp. JGI-2019a]
MFEKRTQDRESQPLSTGATIDFVRQEGSSSSGGGELSRPLVSRHRRASMSMAVYRAGELATDTQASDQLRVTFAQPELVIRALSGSGTSATVSLDKND